MAFITMPMVTAAINALPGRLASHGNALLKYDTSTSWFYRNSNLGCSNDNTNYTTFIAFWEELDKNESQLDKIICELASQYGGQEGAMKVYYNL